MKHKLIPAYEPESSTTTRLNAEDTAKFLAKFTIEQISEVNVYLNQELGMLGEEHKKEYLANIGFNISTMKLPRGFAKKKLGISMLKALSENPEFITKLIKTSEEKK